MSLSRLCASCSSSAPSMGGPLPPVPVAWWHSNSSKRSGREGMSEGWSGRGHATVDLDLDYLSVPV
ncbi:unnamed protein product [Acanthoscelides obtectus]|uniref:Uncharacterized protein n=1 Tax=Acanthoscelides obtectus TaxID=200917 RepID=A0A9P0K5S3_ACAOB|nr:unnamed protein product [Acanthoscelides obtectus]CAK1622761.1 hypothetical protein AOBTE_LOCUS1659 [Acanthoscelides obtectus]